MSYLFRFIEQMKCFHKFSRMFGALHQIDLIIHNKGRNTDRMLFAHRRINFCGIAHFQKCTHRGNAAGDINIVEFHIFP